MRHPVWKCLLSLTVLLVILALHGPAQQEDVDTDTAILILNIERALRLEILGGPVAVTISAADFGKTTLPLSSFKVLVNSLVDYEVVTYAVASPPDIGVSALQVRVSKILGPFEQIIAGEFTAIGDIAHPLALFTGGNNIGGETVATVDFQFNLRKLAGRPLGDSHTFVITFAAMER